MSGKELFTFLTEMMNFQPEDMLELQSKSCGVVPCSVVFVC